MMMIKVPKTKRPNGDKYGDENSAKYVMNIHEYCYNDDDDESYL